MKKWITLLLVIGTLCLSGCAQKNQVSLPDEEKNTTKATSAIEGDTTVPENATSDQEEAAPAAIPSQLTRNDDGSYTILLPVTEYLAEEREEDDTIHLEYDDFGNITRFWGEYLSDDEVLSQIKYDNAGRPVSVKLGIYDDEYNYTYDEDGTLIAIEGLMESGERPFRFTRTTENGAAWELTEFWPNTTQVLRYDANFRQLERGSYKPDADPSTYEASQRFTYDKYGRLTQWDWLNHDDVAFDYTADDFDAMGHCLTKNSVYSVLKDDGSGETEQQTGMRAWSSQIETDDQGRVIRDVHAYADDPESPYIITYSYEYDGDALAGFTYTAFYPSISDQLLEDVYEPVTLHCDELQIAFLMIYGQDLPINQANRYRGFDVDMRN